MTYSAAAPLPLSLGAAFPPLAYAGPFPSRAFRHFLQSLRIGGMAASVPCCTPVFMGLAMPRFLVVLPSPLS